ncbi:MAG: Pnap_2097 family protein [Bacteroidota bacterium]
MSQILSIIRNSVGEVAEADLNTPIEDLGIDSIDFFDLRVALDNHAGKEIADSDWLGFTTFQQILDYYDAGQNGNGQAATSIENSDPNFRQHKINMPQMALTGLSENWLFKEIGDFHWNVLCQGLGTDSSQIQDEFGNRLYATFVRIRLINSTHLRDFKENESLSMRTEMSRYGNSMYFSNLKVQGDENKSIDAQLMTTFSYRNKENNKSLKKGQPYGVNNTIEAVSAMPDFGQQYRFLRKKELETVDLLGEVFQVTDNELHQRTYQINPYLDLNGVGLLYFAAYPIINDVCEARYFNEHHPNLVREHWANEAYTLARDVYYMSNCNITDDIIYRVHEMEILADNRVRIQSTLSRSSDGQTLARMFTIKSLVGRS